LVDAPPTGPVSRSLPDRAGIVIIGAGIVGCSVAYHLAQRGVKDIVIIEQDRWPEPGGSTQHASNFSFPIDHPEVMAKSSKYGLEFYAALQYQDKSCLITAGGLEIARTNYRMRELKRKVASGKSW
jgi:glycine/D-amino acid oxidase-like deaminating enzyme